MKARELAELSTDELEVRERELSEALFQLRLRRAASQLENPMKLRQTRRDLARVKTLLRARATGRR